ncbi:MAG: hypothetical protein Q9170_001103 [Blastenia crenularia]
MAEVLGVVASGLTVAGLFKICIQAFDLIETARHQDTDLRRLALRFNIEKCRLYTWGEAMGLTAPPARGQSGPLETTMFNDLVCGTLQAILDTFRDTQKMKDQYGCREVAACNGGKSPIVQPSSSDPVKSLAAAFSNFNIADVTRNKMRSFTSQTRWAVHDRKKFAELITEAKALIDGLQEITKSLSTVARQEGMMRYSIQQVQDEDTLQLVADVSQQDYPDMSDAASIKLDIVTIAGNQRAAIEAWADDVSAGSGDETSDIESMTITELKHRLRMATAGDAGTTAVQSGVVPTSDQADGRYPVEGILAEKTVDGTPSYLVKWKGYDEFQNTWEAEENFEDEQILRGWRETKSLISRGLVDPFNVAAWEQRMTIHEADETSKKIMMGKSTTWYIQ